MNITNFKKMLESLLIDKNLEENLSRIVRNMEQEYSFCSIGIYLKNLKTGTYRIKIARNISHNFEKNILFTEKDPLLKELEALKPINLTNNISYKFEHDYSNLIIIPLHNNRVLMGFLFLDRKEGKFSNTDIHKMTIHASVISLIVSLVNQRLSIEQLTDLDDLTKLFNCKAFHERADKLLSHSKRYQRDITVVIMKLDNYENIVRTIGKENTDDLISEISFIFEHNLRETDLIGRLYRDTFGIAMPETHENISLIAVYRLNEKINALPLMNNFKIGWGILEFNNEISDIEDFINKSVEAAFESTRKVEDNISIYRF